MTLSTVAGPGNSGFWLENHDAYMTSDNAVTKGDVVALDLAVVDSTTDVFDTVDQPATADLAYGIFAVALEDVAASAVGRFRFKGIVEALITGTPAVGAAVSPGNASDALGATAANEKVVGYMLETGVDATTKRVIFDGIAGFGFNET